MAGAPYTNRFTDAFLRGLKPARKPYKRSEWAPKGQGRLIVRVRPSGSKELFYRYRVNGGDTLMALGRFDPNGRIGITLAQANDKLRDVRDVQRETGDAKAHRQAEDRAQELEARKGTLAQLLSGYVQALRDAGKASADAVEGLFRRNVLKPFPTIAAAKAAEIKPGDVQRILARLVRAGATREVNKLRSYMRAAFGYGIKADHDPRTVAREGVLFGLNFNPAATVPRIADFERTGERALTEDELRAFWRALEALPVVQRATLRLNIALACQRPTQLLRAEWPAFDFEQETLLLRDSKGRGGARDHLLPLTTLALEQLKPLQELNPEKKPGEEGPNSPFVGDGKHPMALETLSKAVREISDELKREKGIAPFQMRDLRRTAETMLQKMGIEKEVRAHLLSHGRSQGVQGKHYERYDFLTEKRQALEAWARHLARVLDPKRKAKVVSIAGRAA